MKESLKKKIWTKENLLLAFYSNNKYFDVCIIDSAILMASNDFSIVAEDYDFKFSDAENGQELLIGKMAEEQNFAEKKLAELPEQLEREAERKQQEKAEELARLEEEKRQKRVFEKFVQESSDAINSILTDLTETLREQCKRLAHTVGKTPEDYEIASLQSMFHDMKESSMTTAAVFSRNDNENYRKLVGIYKSLFGPYKFSQKEFNSAIKKVSEYQGKCGKLGQMHNKNYTTYKHLIGSGRLLKEAFMMFLKAGGNIGTLVYAQGKACDMGLKGRLMYLFLLRMQYTIKDPNLKLHK